MNDAKTQTLTRIIMAFNTTYACFLVDHHLTDNAVARAAFYVVCERMVERDPIPDRELQEAVTNYLIAAKTRAVEEYDKLLEDTFHNVSCVAVR